MVSGHKCRIKQAEAELHHMNAVGAALWTSLGGFNKEGKDPHQGICDTRPVSIHPKGATQCLQC